MRFHALKIELIYSTVRQDDLLRRVSGFNKGMWNTVNKGAQAKNSRLATTWTVESWSPVKYNENIGLSLL